MLNGIRKIFVRLRRDESGATLVEYGIALFVAIAVGGFVLTDLGAETFNNFEAADEAATRPAAAD
ncbi:Flp family type IVb pilin [Ruegeria arenilitoris]|uniref:Flp family type IVb pilin n=1 Tax=Ruegeria arenilitoris TaxID=1173585 RepID=UPI00147B978D|nr:Flp family type IVb pilin [Ruegeria arenilitoris]